MIIVDLSYLESLAESTTLLGGARTSIRISGLALGDSTSVDAYLRSRAYRSPYRGSIAMSSARISATAYDPVDAYADTDAEATASGDVTRSSRISYSIDSGTHATSTTQAYAVGITHS